MDYRPSTEEVTQHLVFSRSLLQRNECAVEVEDSNVHSDSQTKITEYFGKGANKWTTDHQLRK
jgi:hypothetical protein